LSRKSYPLSKSISPAKRAVSEPDVRKRMDIEDEILEDLQDLERQIENKDKIIEELKKQLNIKST